MAISQIPPAGGGAGAQFFDGFEAVATAYATATVDYVADVPGLYRFIFAPPVTDYLGTETATVTATNAAGAPADFTAGVIGVTPAPIYLDTGSTATFDMGDLMIDDAISGANVRYGYQRYGSIWFSNSDDNLKVGTNPLDQDTQIAGGSNLGFTPVVYDGSYYWFADASNVWSSPDGTATWTSTAAADYAFFYGANGTAYSWKSNDIRPWNNGTALADISNITTGDIQQINHNGSATPTMVSVATGPATIVYSTDYFATRGTASFYPGTAPYGVTWDGSKWWILEAGTSTTTNVLYTTTDFSSWSTAYAIANYGFTASSSILHYEDNTVFIVGPGVISIDSTTGDFIKGYGGFNIALTQNRFRTLPFWAADDSGKKWTFIDNTRPSYFDNMRTFNTNVALYVYRSPIDTNASF